MTPNWSLKADQPMASDPLSKVRDEALIISDEVMGKLASYRIGPKLELLSGVDPRSERDRLTRVLDALADEIIAGVRASPRKLFVMERFQHALEQVQMEDTEAREHFGTELERLMDLLGIDSSDGLLNHYVLGLDL